MKEKKWAVLCEKWFQGEVTLPKITLWLACSVCLLAGMVYGLRKAPWTHGVTIASNNGNNNGNGNVNGGEEAAGDEEAAGEEEA